MVRVSSERAFEFGLSGTQSEEMARTFDLVATAGDVPAGASDCSDDKLGQIKRVYHQAVTDARSCHPPILGVGGLGLTGSSWRRWSGRIALTADGGMSASQTSGRSDFDISATHLRNWRPHAISRQAMGRCPPERPNTPRVSWDKSACLPQGRRSVQSR